MGLKLLLASFEIAADTFILMHTMLTTSSEDGTPLHLEPSGPTYGVSTEGIQYRTDNSVVSSDGLRCERLPKNWDLYVSYSVQP